MKPQKTLFILFLILLSFVFSSCATIFHGAYQKVEIFSKPDSCSVYLNGENTNKVTPCKVRVKRRIKPTFYNEKNEQSYILKKDGYYDFEVKDKVKFNPLVIGNIGLVLGGVATNAILPTPDGGSDDARGLQLAAAFPIVGGVVDAISGAYNKYPTRVFAELKSKPGNIKITNRPDNIEPSNISSTGNKIALCIGNANYSKASSLANPVNDAYDISYSLKQLGFEVIKLENATQLNMKKAIDEFGKKLKNSDVGLFFYAGHGIQAKGINYLVPIDADIKSENDVEYTCVNANRVLGKMEDAGTTINIVILDACRNNPFERSWTRSTKGRGLVVMDAPTGSLIGFATSPGNTALDGQGRNGLYTSALLNYINEPGITILEMFQKVRKMVRKKSSGTQVPWESTSLEGNFYFKK